ncbi:MAG: FdtA/QdtA family cupin domain-containing protein [Muribaculaceae bacterium]|nr:FdtA/QdtA family cupin domain-containing protein [Muribaculaceae bacterium]MDE6331059.1 FdtA/QdtA family cupin domain-containing protein [Muribaculaceae bacterium]
MPNRNSSTVDDARIITLDPHHSERKGDLCVVQGMHTVPFPVERVFYIYDVPAGAERGVHSHIRDHELIVAVSGSFAVKVDDGYRSRVFMLKRPYEMLHIPPGLWVQLFDFSSGSVALVMCRYGYDKSDYINSYSEFLKLKS